MIYFQCETLNVLTFNIFKLSLKVLVENIEVVFRRVIYERIYASRIDFEKLPNITGVSM